MAKARGLRVPEGLEREIERETKRRGTSWSATAIELLDEAVRMRRVPGVVFTQGPAGRRATVAGSGLDVWEIVRTWHQDVDRDYLELRKVYAWLTEPQLRAALTYYELYADEIDQRLDLEESWTPERVSRDLPFARTPASNSR